MPAYPPTAQDVTRDLHDAWTVLDHLTTRLEAVTSEAEQRVMVRSRLTLLEGRIGDLAITLQDILVRRSEWRRAGKREKVA
jgi:hypothetical protein